MASGPRLTVALWPSTENATSRALPEAPLPPPLPALPPCDAEREREGARAGDPGSGGMEMAPLPAREGVSVAEQLQGLPGALQRGRQRGFNESKAGRLAQHALPRARDQMVQTLCSRWRLGPAPGFARGDSGWGWGCGGRARRGPPQGDHRIVLLARDGVVKIQGDQGGLFFVHPVPPVRFQRVNVSDI
jgi:hypothetical protein